MAKECEEKIYRKSWPGSGTAGMRSPLLAMKQRQLILLVLLGK